jgi:hypothetical protein
MESEIKDGIEIIAVSEVEQVLRVALKITNPEEFMRPVANLKLVEKAPEEAVTNKAANNIRS